MKYRIKTKTKGTREVGEQKLRRRMAGNVCREGPAKKGHVDLGRDIEHCSMSKGKS